MALNVINVLQLSARSIKGKWPEVTQMISKNHIHIVLIQET